MIKEPTQDNRFAAEDPLTREIIGAAIAVHKELGPGLLENAYHACLEFELLQRHIPFKRQMPLPVVYKGHTIDCTYKLDLLVDNLVVVELKTVEKILPVHEAQLLTYMRLAQKSVGLLFNFNSPFLRDAIVRRVL